DGWEYTQGWLGCPWNRFEVRFCALRAARHFFRCRPGVVAKAKLVHGMKLLLEQPDMADLAAEELRKERCWEPEEKVLALYHRPSHDIPIVRRAILRYALTCPNEKSKAFAATFRKKDPDAVADVEELLKLE